MACDLLHADDTPIRVLDRSRRSAGLGRKAVKQGRVWAYVRDQTTVGRGRPRQAPSTASRPISRRASTRAGTSAGQQPASCRPTPTAASDGLYEPRASTADHHQFRRGRLLGASAPAPSTTCGPPPKSDHRPRRARPDRRALRRRTPDLRPQRRRAPRRASLTQRAPGRGVQAPGPRGSSDASPARATSPRLSATPSSAGRPSRSSSRTAASPSTTIRPSAPCAPSASAAATGSSRARTPAARPSPAP